MPFFFFSSRRRHTSLQGDWSSDVCSSDLAMKIAIDHTTRYVYEHPVRYSTQYLRMVPPSTRRQRVRSEERRVGKERRGRGAGERGKTERGRRMGGGVGWGRAGGREGRHEG